MHTRKLFRLVVATAILSPVMLASACIVSQAADAPRPYRVPPPPPPPLFYNWTGLYAGVHVGGGFADLGVGDTDAGVIRRGFIVLAHVFGERILGARGKTV